MALAPASASPENAPPAAKPAPKEPGGFGAALGEATARRGALEPGGYAVAQAIPPEGDVVEPANVRSKYLPPDFKGSDAVVKMLDEDVGRVARRESGLLRNTPIVEKLTKLKGDQLKEYVSGFVQASAFLSNNDVRTQFLKAFQALPEAAKDDVSIAVRKSFYEGTSPPGSGRTDGTIHSDYMAALVDPGYAGAELYGEPTAVGASRNAAVEMITRRGTADMATRTGLNLLSDQLHGIRSGTRDPDPVATSALVKLADFALRESPGKATSRLARDVIDAAWNVEGFGTVLGKSIVGADTPAALATARLVDGADRRGILGRHTADKVEHVFQLVLDNAGDGAELSDDVPAIAVLSVYVLRNFGRLTTEASIYANDDGSVRIGGDRKTGPSDIANRDDAKLISQIVSNLVLAPRGSDPEAKVIRDTLYEAITEKIEASIVAANETGYPPGASPEEVDAIRGAREAAAREAGILVGGFAKGVTDAIATQKGAADLLNRGVDYFVDKVVGSIPLAGELTGFVATELKNAAVNAAKDYLKKEAGKAVFRADDFKAMIQGQLRARFAVRLPNDQQPNAAAIRGAFEDGVQAGTNPPG